jgi:hypothetical protein
MNKKGQMALITFIISGIIIVTFFAGWLYFFNTMTNVMQSIPSSTNQVNISYAVSSVLAPVNNAMNGLNLLSVVILLGLILGIFIESYYVRKHPILFVIHLLIWIVSITASIYISNSYETLMTNDILGSYITQNTGASFISLNLPMITAIIGAIGIFLIWAILEE